MNLSSMLPVMVATPTANACRLTDKHWHPLEFEMGRIKMQTLIFLQRPTAIELDFEYRIVELRHIGRFVQCNVRNRVHA